jgi:hypothetical protein
MLCLALSPEVGACPGEERGGKDPSMPAMIDLVEPICLPVSHFGAAWPHVCLLRLNALSGLSSCPTYAARIVKRTRSVAGALGARSNSRPSGVLATLLLALEGIFVSPCSPTNISLFRCVQVESVGCLLRSLSTKCLRAGRREWDSRVHRFGARARGFRPAGGGAAPGAFHTECTRQRQRLRLSRRTTVPKLSISRPIRAIYVIKSTSIIKIIIIINTKIDSSRARRRGSASAVAARARRGPAGRRAGAAGARRAPPRPESRITEPPVLTAQYILYDYVAPVSCFS